jgi:hypothetical protein
MVPINLSITEEPLFAVDLAAIEPDVERTDEVQASYSFAIATRAEYFEIIPGTELRFLRTRAGLGGCPAMWFYFTIDSIYACTLQRAAIAEESTPPSIFGDPRPLPV